MNGYEEYLGKVDLGTAVMWFLFISVFAGGLIYAMINMWRLVFKRDDKRGEIK